MKSINVIFMGTPDFAVPILEKLIEVTNVIMVVSQPDKEIGRKRELEATPVKKMALSHNIEVYQPNKIKEEYEYITNKKPDLIITCAYGQIVPKEILECPRLGCINVHASLLPKLRGGAPIHRAIIEGYKNTGITIMYMNSKMDAGDIIEQASIEITDVETASTLHDKLSYLAKDLIIKTLPKIFDGTANRIKQDESQVTYGFVIKREDERINFDRTKKEIYNQIRGLNSWPGAYCLFEGKTLKVWNSYMTDNYFPNLFNGQITNVYENGFGVKVSNGEVVFTIVQPEGKKKMSAIDFVNGHANLEKIEGKILD